MEIMDVTETGITVSLVNHTELNMEFGEEYSLEVWNGTGWEAVPYEDGQWAFHSIAYSMPENQPVEWKADWEALYGTLEPGQYRLVKPVMDFRGPGDFTEYGLTAEFELPVQALQEPPVLRLQDSLSSTLRSFSWSRKIIHGTVNAEPAEKCRGSQPAEPLPRSVSTAGSAGAYAVPGNGRRFIYSILYSGSRLDEYKRILQGRHGKSGCRACFGNNPGSWGAAGAQARPDV